MLPWDIGLTPEVPLKWVTTATVAWKDMEMTTNHTLLPFTVGDFPGSLWSLLPVRLPLPTAAHSGKKPGAPALHVSF